MDEWERLERRWKIICRVVGVAVGATSISCLLSSAPQTEQFTIM